MKIAFCTEDRSDERVLSIVLSRVLGTEVVPYEIPFLVERGGWTKALELAPRVARQVHYSDATGAVFAIDNDAGDPLHDAGHANQTGCRHCQLVAAARVDEVRLWPREPLQPLRFVFVVPVRTIETWALLSRATAPSWDPLKFGSTPNERRALKRQLFGTDRPDTELVIQTCVPIFQSVNLDDLANRSPSFRLFRDQAQLEMLR